MKPPEYYRGKEQTYVKHFFLEQYLETLAFHIGYTQNELVYVDCFSGPWRALDEALADTSIRIALDTLNYVRDGLAKEGRTPNIRAIFIEKMPDAFTALQAALVSHSRAIKTTALQGTFEDNIKSISENVRNAFAFFFIDPTGWTGFAMERITPLLQHKPGEVMVNFMYDFVNRFLNYPNTANEQSLDRFFGTSDWRNIREAPDRETASVNLYTEQLRTAGAFTYATSTRILKPLHDRAYFHLVYATRNPKGILEFRNVEKKAVKAQEDVRDTAQREHREQRTGQTEICFGETADLSATVKHQRAQQLNTPAQQIATLVAHGPIPYEKLEPLILQLPLVWHTDLNKILIDAHKNGTLTIQGLKPRQRAPKHGNIIRRP